MRTVIIQKCAKRFYEVLRLECINASWVERFYWNDETQECEAFWYDSSCDPKDVSDRNFFESLENCQKFCRTKGHPGVTFESNFTWNGAANSNQILVLTSPSPLQEMRGSSSGNRRFKADDPLGLLQSKETNGE
ncbi:hypothetical protein GCK32_020723 [Trichostrongylus colubriformis]|uniref:BPTI/Kunitz inhibitor domain-containing protein n=1 Tax=Trichostrongylus colubriformis TaxID=6319 RepID=A0AAN8FK82_TRICO